MRVEKRRLLPNTVTARLGTAVNARMSKPLQFEQVKTNSLALLSMPAIAERMF
jgi:hypothetical protein